MTNPDAKAGRLLSRRWDAILSAEAERSGDHVLMSTVRERAFDVLVKEEVQRAGESMRMICIETAHLCEREAEEHRSGSPAWTRLRDQADRLRIAATGVDMYGSMDPERICERRIKQLTNERNEALTQLARVREDAAQTHAERDAMQFMLTQVGHERDEARGALRHAEGEVASLRVVRNAAREYLMRSVADPNTGGAAEDVLREALADLEMTDAAAAQSPTEEKFATNDDSLGREEGWTDAEVAAQRLLRIAAETWLMARDRKIERMPKLVDEARQALQVLACAEHSGAVSR